MKKHFDTKALIPRKTIYSAMRKGRALTCIVLTLMVALPSAGYLAADTSKDVTAQPVLPNSNYITHAPIRINSNAEFASMAASEGWPGDGSQGSPYIIDNYDINYTKSGFIINNVQNGIIFNNFLWDNLWDGIYLYSSNGNLVANNTALHHSMAGITLASSNQNIIQNNNASNNQYGIYSTVSYNGNNVVINNTLWFNNGGIIVFGWDNNIVNNTIFYSYNGISGEGGYNNTFINNVIINNVPSSYPWYGFFIGSRGNVLANNTMVGGGIMIGGGSLEIWNSQTIDTSNTVNGKPVYYWKNQTGGSVPSGAGEVILANCTNVVVENQNVSYGTVGIQLGFSSGNIIANNTALSNRYGIHLISSNINSILNNTVSLNVIGINFTESNNNIVSGNIFNSNGSGSGIQTYYSNNNTFENNKVSSLYTGIYFVYSSGNTIYHNNISNNVAQAYDNRNNNFWNSTYPTGGNYWSDYSGVDLCSGPLQNQPGSDGVGDTPYIIDADSRDNYPLMSPFDYIEYNIPLQEGWNLISLPVRQFNWSFSSVLESVAGKYDYIQTYNTSNPSSPWETYAPFKPASVNNLNSMNHFRSYWVHITEPGITLTVKGDKFGSTLSLPLKAGWNLVGYPSLTPKSISVALAGTGYDSVEGYNASDPYRTSVLDGSYMMKPGEGYWVHVPADSIWVVDW
jgi:parallel beta-helix repeat protein